MKQENKLKSNISKIDNADEKYDSVQEKNDWKKFGSSCVSNLSITLLISLIACNFIYFTNLTSASLDILFPSKLQEYFSLQTGGFINSKCRMGKTELNVLGQSLKKIGIPPTRGWPYNLKDNSIMELTKQGVKNWIALSSADIYILFRNVIKSVLMFFSDVGGDDIFSSDIVKIIFVTLITFMTSSIGVTLGLPVFLFGAFCVSYVLSCFRALNDSDILFTAFIAFFGPAGILAAGSSISLFFQFIFTILLLPLVIDSSLVKKILLCNIPAFGNLLTFLCIISAYQYLPEYNIMIPLSMLVTLFYIVLISR